MTKRQKTSVKRWKIERKSRNFAKESDKLMTKSHKKSQNNLEITKTNEKCN